ncbi:MAG: mechanosensitive ion channel, partial [Kiloniellales bacterium]|nr:mechanosensitive ion channel [Kiloniellales bacterium]
MTDFVDPNELMAWFVAASEWTVENVFNRWVLIQLVIIAVLYGIAWLLARRIRPWVTSRLDKLQVSPRFARLAQSAPRMLRPVAFAILLWTVVAVMRQVTWPSYSYLLAVASNLLTAWIVISFASTFIRNEAISRIFALATWSIAALNMTDLLAPTVAILDSAAMNFGELRISVLTILQALLSLAVLLWAALALSRALETRINRVPDLTPSVQVLLGKLIKITLLAFAVVIALNTVGIDLTALALFSGAIGVGIGFGLQKVVSNLISGVILLLDKSIKPGDVIELEDTFGWITSLGARYVSVNTRDGKEYLIPNEDLITHRVVNWSFSNQLVRLEIPIGVSYDSDPH